MDARDYAVLMLDQASLPGLPQEAFKRRSPVAPEDPRDRALSEQIIAGVIKNYIHLDKLIGIHAKRSSRQVDARARLILLVALYQMRFLDRIPDHAIVTEAVRQTRRLDPVTLQRASGFVNAVLRQALREPDVFEKLPKRTNAPAYAEAVLSHPRTLFARLADLLGEKDALAFCEHDNRTPPTLVRLTPGTTIDDLRKSAPEVVEIVPHEQEGICVVTGGRYADFARWSDAGVAQVQDATSAAVVGELDVRPGQAVLDRCCGLGTKTQQLSEAVGGEGAVFAVDAMGSRINRLRRLVRRRPDLLNITAKRAEWMEELPPEWPGAYDRILIDAPCSNTGVLARRAEARYHQSDEALEELVQLQKAILADTWPALSPRGLMAYATCSVLPEENGRLMAQFLRATPEAELVSERAWWPSFATTDATRYRDGGYVAVLRRKKA